MTLFDINVGLGRAADPVRGSFDTAADVLVEMDRLGVAEALVYHCLASEGDLRLGNRVLLEKIRGESRLHPCWVLAPPAFGDLPEPGRWIREALDSGVRAVRLFPTHGLYEVSEWWTGDLLGEVARARLPVLLDFGTQHWSQKPIPWEKIRGLCEAFHELSIVVVGATVGDVREVAQLLARLPNFHLETHAFPVPDIYERFVQAGVARQVVFGTGMPRRGGECSAAQIQIAGIDAESLGAMGSGNARRLMRLATSGDTEEILSACSPRPEGRVVDVHAHIGSWERISIPLSRAEGFVRSMDRCGISQLVFSSFSAIHGEMRLGNQEAADEAAKFPDRLFAYCAINPHFPHEIDEELHLCFDQSSSFVGLKFHCGLHCAQLHDAGYERALAYANEHHLPVLVHGGGVDRWQEVCGRFPRASFIMAHACAWDGRDTAGRDLFALARDTQNLYLDVAGSPAHRGALAALVSLVGVDKVLYGSDFPMFDLGFEVGRVTLSELSSTDKHAILEGNARKIFKRLP